MSARPLNVAYDFSGQVVLVTGAARGQGRSHALAFARAGADLVIADICAQVETVEYAMATPEDLAATAADVERHGVRCLAHQCDIRVPEQVRGVVDAAVEAFGRIDVLVNNAGIDNIFHITELAVDTWDDMIETHLRGTFLMSKAVAPVMIEQGRGKIVTTGSVNSFIGLPSHAHYTTAKHGLVGFTKALALDLAPHRINVNIVCPGAIRSPMNAMMEGHEDWAQAIGPLGGPWNLMGGEDVLLDPQEISNAVLWFASEASNFVTGASLLVDAGASIK